MFNRITAVALALGLGFSTAIASADATPIFEAPIGAQEASKSKRFAINPALGRAWVEIDIWHSASETSESHQIQVPGLSYDKNTAQIVFISDGRSVVCANVRDAGGWIFKHQRIEPTGRCELIHKYVTVPVDDGFVVEGVQRFEVHFKASHTASGATP